MPSNTNVRDALRWGVRKLRGAGVNSPELDAELLLGHIVGHVANALHLSSIEDKCNACEAGRSWLYAHSEQQVSRTAGQQYRKFIARRVKREPVAYIIGHKEFYGLNFLVNKHVLIPRPETEMLVEQAIREVVRCQVSGVRCQIVDVGTGSGCLIIALAKQLSYLGQQSSGRPQKARSDFLWSQGSVVLVATDCSAKALTVARRNARRHGALKRIKFLRGNLLKPLKDVILRLKAEGSRTPPKADAPRAQNVRGSHARGILRFAQNDGLVIVANLPYLSTAEWRATMPEVRRYEPRQALEGGKDGLKYYREMFYQLSAVSSRLSATILCEICPEQAAVFQKMVRGYFPPAKFRVVKDLAGRKRVIIVKI